MEKRYKVHNMIKGMNVGESVDLELMKELTEKYGVYENVDVGITNNGKEMTYKEVVDLLNENEQLKEALKELKEIGDYQAMVIQESYDMKSLIEGEIDKKIAALTEAKIKSFQNGDEELLGKIKFSIQVLRELKEVILE